MQLQTFNEARKSCHFNDNLKIVRLHINFLIPDQLDRKSVLTASVMNSK